MTHRYVFQVKVRPGEEENFERYWHNQSISIQQCAGARGTRLHKKSGMKSIYIAIAEWDSAEARKVAFLLLNQPQNALGEEMRQWGCDSDFGEMTLIAELDEIDFVTIQSSLQD